MDKKFKKKWVEALTSGKYNQTQGALKRKAEDGTVGFCCLGVACDLAKNYGATWSDDLHSGIDGFDASVEYSFRKLDKLGRKNHSLDQKYGISDGYMPDWLADKLGISSSDQDDLVGLNDGGNSFKRIAKYIEENL